MKATWQRWLASVGFAAAVGVPVVRAQSPPPLGSANSYAVLGTAVVNSGPSVISGNAGAPVTGFPPGTFRLGPNASGDEAPRARSDAAAAFALLPALCNPPGVSCVTVPFSGVYTIDARALRIFVSNGPLTVASNAVVAVSNGGKSGNVWWKVNGSVTLGAGSTMAGNILATGDITFGHGASLSGRALSIGGTVTLDTNIVSLCCDPIMLDGNGTPSGGLPPYAVSVIEGTRPDASQCGCFSFTLMATDALGCRGVRRYTVDGPAPVAITTTDLLPATACVRYEQKINANCGTFSGQPPPGLTLLPNGVLCGTPVAAGVFTFDVTATACSGTATQQLTLNVLGNKLQIDPPTLPNGTVGTFYTVDLAASPIALPYTFAVTSGSLPAGLKLCGHTISGIPKIPGDTSFTVTASEYGCLGSHNYTIHINACPLTLSPATLPNGTVGLGYPPVTLSASGGTPPYTFMVSSGTLPPGLKLSLAGVIYNTPTTAGTRTVTIQATDASGCAGKITYTITIDPPPVFTVGVPAMSPWALLLLFLGMAVIALVYVRRIV